MRLVLQRVAEGVVTVSGTEVGRIGRGLVVYVGMTEGDCDDDLDWCARKLCALKLWDSADSTKRWQQGVVALGLEILLISQFTLYSVVKSGNKPDFHLALSADLAGPLFDSFVSRVRSVLGSPDKVKTGSFGAHMMVSSVVDGPVTIQLDSRVRN